VSTNPNIKLPFPTETPVDRNKYPKVGRPPRIPGAQLPSSYDGSRINPEVRRALAENHPEIRAAVLKVADAQVTSMPKRSDQATRTDTGHIGKTIRLMLERIVETGRGWQVIADELGIDRKKAKRGLDKAHVRAALAAERKAALDLVTSGNVAAAAKIRDDAENSMAQLGAIRTLEQMHAEAHTPGASRMVGAPLVPGLIVQVITPVLAQPHHVIDHERDNDLINPRAVTAPIERMVEPVPRVPVPPPKPPADPIPPFRPRGSRW
jgi:hypothetical protein